MTLAESVTSLVAWNTARVHRIDGDAPNPAPIDDEPWVATLRGRHDRILAEWQAFTGAGNQLPLLDDLLGGNQGNVGGWWRGAPLIARRRPRAPLAEHFPETSKALLAIPGLLSAMWSVFGPGATLPPHTGDNAGALNLLVGVDCPPGSEHEIGGRTFTLEPGQPVLFDDTLEHSAWNRSDQPRVVLLGDVLRPLPRGYALTNAAVQLARHRLVPQYRRVIDVHAELHRELNS